MYRKNLLRFGIALGLLLVAAYLFSVRTPGQTQDGWQRLRRALVGPSALAGFFMLMAAVQNLSRTWRRRLGAWAIAQVEAPGFELCAGPVFGALVLYNLASRGAGGVSESGAWLAGLAVFASLLGFFVVKECSRLRRHWSTLTGHTVCENCGYIVDDLQSERCPECASRLAARAKEAPFGSGIRLR